MAVTVPTITTADELLHMPDDGMRHELVRGKLLTMTPPGAEHGRVAVTVGGLLFIHARKTGSGVTVGETGFVLARDPDTVRAPDAAFISKERAETIGRTPKYWPEAPALAVEVISPDDTYREVRDKAFEWLAAGSAIVLVVDPPKRTATVYSAEDNTPHVHSEWDTLDLSDAVPGFSVAVAELFA
ncbi:MAG TPA: Uma2 family endonuclease [Solirubrobacteraceae bacterium]|jgi:Uma2 family endonuclease